jgi:hypothetical protein
MKKIPNENCEPLGSKYQSKVSRQKIKRHHTTKQIYSIIESTIPNKTYGTRRNREIYNQNKKQIPVVNKIRKTIVIKPQKQAGISGVITFPSKKYPKVTQNNPK